MPQRKSPLDKYLGTLGTGTVQWIGVRPRRREALHSLSQVRAVADLGLEGDHRMSKTPGSGRQVTLISREFMTQIAAQLGEADLDPARLRRRGGNSSGHLEPASISASLASYRLYSKEYI